MAKITSIDLYGVTGSGRNKTEAKADAVRQIEAAFQGGYTPEVVTYRGETALVYRTPGGWVYTLIQTEGKVREGTCYSTSGSGDDRDVVVRAARGHVAQNAWTFEDGTDNFPDFLDDAQRSDLAYWARFQLRCRRAKEAGVTDSQEIHSYGCESFCPQELKERVEGAPAAVRIYTSAPECYDGFGTRTVEPNVGSDCGKQIRLVETPVEHEEWQRSRYFSGCYSAFCEQVWQQLLAGGMVSRWEPCPVVGPGGERCELRGKGHAAPHTWEECQAVGPEGVPCYGVEPIGPEGHPRPSRAGHAGGHSFEATPAEAVA